MHTPRTPMSSDDLFRSLWRLMFSHLFQDVVDDFGKFYSDLFSSSFLRAIELADPAERTKFLAALGEESRIAKIAGSSELRREAIKLLIVFLRGDAKNNGSDLAFIGAIFTPESLALSQLSLPEVAFLLPRLISESGTSLLFSRVDAVIVPQLRSADQMKSFLAACPQVAQNIQRTMESSVRDIVEWVHDEYRRESDLELTLEFLASTPRMQLFRHLSVETNLKEKFLACIAGAVSLLPGDSAAGKAVRAAFFTVPAAGDVMDRWFANETKKYNGKLFSAAKEYLTASGPVGMEELRAVLRSCFEQSSIVLPYGGRADEKIGQFLESVMPGFVYLPCAVSGTTLVGIFSHFPSLFDIQPDMVSLTPLGMKHSAKVFSSGIPSGTVAPLASTVSSSEVAAAAPAGLSSELEGVLSAPASRPSSPDDLRDILLREILQRLPQNAFLHRPYPTKVQAGVYRFGTREVTFHVKGGELQVYRVGDYVSESDGTEFVAREFGVGVDKLRKPSAEKPSEQRRPVDWHNKDALYRLVRRGFKAKDAAWREGWMRAGGPADLKSAPLEFLVRFLEKHIAHAAKQPWAKDLLYEGGGPESDSEGGGEFEAGVVVPPVNEGHPNYKTRLCTMFQQGRCNRGAACGYAHGAGDLRGGAPQQFYKTRMCNAFLEGRCNRGAACSYAHSETERVASSSGVVRRDIKGTQDLRLAAKMEVMGGANVLKNSSSSRERSPRGVHTSHAKPLPYIPPPRHQTGPRSRIDENEL